MVLFLEKNRSLLLALRKYKNLHKINKQDIVPGPIYDFIVKKFSLGKKKEEIKANVYILKLIGGDFDFNKGKNFSIKGFLSVVEEFEMSSWAPVYQFINKFRDTLTLDARLSEKLGKSMLPLVEKYYDYLDMTSKLRLLSELCVDWKKYNFKGIAEQDNDQLALRIFQSSGPIIVKLLQEMQEEIVGDTPVSEVLKSLANSKGMRPEKAKAITKNEVLSLLQKQKLDSFRFRSEPLGIASIAQTHLFQYSGDFYVVKIQKDKISDVFAREVESINRMMENEPVFDRGMKKRIYNANIGILEELDFNNERRNLKVGNKLYSDKSKSIFTVKVPQRFLGNNRLKLNPKVMIMNIAKGEPLGKIMERAVGSEIQKAYILVQKLYRKFLQVALDDSLEKNFYHGDLHRENIFLNLDSSEIDIIDFGNAGFLQRRMKRNILKVYENSKYTNTDDEPTLDKAILSLAEVLKNIVIEQEEKVDGDTSTRKMLVDSFFRTCFNPEVKSNDKLYESKKLEATQETLCTKKSLIFKKNHLL